MRITNRWMGVVLVALLATSTLTLTGCGTISKIFGDGDDKERAASFAAFGAANKIFADDKADYAAARATIRAARIARRISPERGNEEKWIDFRISQGQIQAAAPIVEADLDTWGATGKKPELYDAHHKTLRDALAEVLSIAKEFE